MSETLRIIKDRFSCRSFTEKMPTDEYLKLIAEAGTQAPSGMDRQGWHISVVKNKDLIREMEDEGKKILEAMDKKMYEKIMSRGGKVFYNAPCMIMISIKETNPRGAEMVDCGILAQTMVLAAESLGLNTLHCGFAGLSFAGAKREEFIKRLQFPEGYQPGMAILLGYADNPTAAHIPNPDKISIIE